jgi:hypothetical protein
MGGEIEALAHIPVPNIIAYGAVMVTILVTVMLTGYWVIRKLNIRAIGPIKREQQNQSTMYNMNDDNSAADDLCRRNMRNIASSMRNRITGLFSDTGICTMTRTALSSALRFPLYESVANNHFTTELMPDSYDEYRHRIVASLKDEYIAIYLAARETKCHEDDVKSWEEAKDIIIKEIADSWLKQICRECMRTCEKKVAIYRKYLPLFEDAGDDYRVKIVKDCINKNEVYITALQRRIA